MVDIIVPYVLSFLCREANQGDDRDDFDRMEMEMMNTLLIVKSKVKYSKLIGCVLVCLRYGGGSGGGKMNPIDDITNDE